MLENQTKWTRDLEGAKRRFTDASSAYVKLVRRYAFNEGQDRNTANERYQLYLNEGPSETNPIFQEMEQAFEEFLNTYLRLLELYDNLGSFLHEVLFESLKLASDDK